MANFATFRARRTTEPCTRDLKWSPAEKAIARKAFDLALRREFEALIKEVKTRAAKISQPDQLWELEHYLTKYRVDIDCCYDFRYSILPAVFADLLHQRRITEADLLGLAEEKLQWIHEYASLTKATSARRAS